MDLTLAQIAAAQDLDLGRSGWLQVDQARIQAFADATDDHQWIHLDVDKARQSRFGGTIAHGFLTLSLLPKLFAQVLQVPEAEMLVNYGLDKLRFLAPVPAGQEICLEARLTSASAQRGGLLMRIRGDMLVRDPGQPDDARRAVVIEALFLVVPREGAA